MFTHEESFLYNINSGEEREIIMVAMALRPIETKPSKKRKKTTLSKAIVTKKVSTRVFNTLPQEMKFEDEKGYENLIIVRQNITETFFCSPELNKYFIS